MEPPVPISRPTIVLLIVTSLRTFPAVRLSVCIRLAERPAAGGGQPGVWIRPPRATSASPASADSTAPAEAPPSNVGACGVGAAAGASDVPAAAVAPSAPTGAAHCLS
eukprot:3923908-Prymnesium_polylepis.1